MIGSILKQIRLIYGYKANEMSLLLGISSSYLSEIENNKKEPTLKLLEKYSDIYGIKLYELIKLLDGFKEIMESENKKTIIINILLSYFNENNK